MHKETLLIVEDNQALRSGLEEILTYEGFSVSTAGNGQEALEQMGKTQPDLILSDISMPVMDGFEFFRQVRRKPEWVTIPFVFLTAHGEREDIMVGRDLGAEDYLVKPLSRDELLNAVRARLARSRQLQMAQLQKAYHETLTMLANAIEVRSEYTRGHVERVTTYSVAVGRLLGLPTYRIEILRFGAILHDIGKIHIRESLLAKKEPLSKEDWEEIRQHPITGAEMIKNVPYLNPAAPIIRAHHERWDGLGYPDGLKGEQIPLEARIIAIADGFDAMTTQRSYNPAHTIAQAFQEIARCAGTQYDPVVVKSFRRAWETGLIKTIAAESSYSG